MAVNPPRALKLPHYRDADTEREKVRKRETGGFEFYVGQYALLARVRVWLRYRLIV
jgi:hypothetical protein